MTNENNTLNKDTIGTDIKRELQDAVQRIYSEHGIMIEDINFRWVEDITSAQVIGSSLHIAVRS